MTEERADYNPWTEASKSKISLFTPSLSGVEVFLTKSLVRTLEAEEMAQAEALAEWVD